MVLIKSPRSEPWEGSFYIRSGFILGILINLSLGSHVYSTRLWPLDTPVDIMTMEFAKNIKKDGYYLHKAPEIKNRINNYLSIHGWEKGQSRDCETTLWITLECKLDQYGSVMNIQQDSANNPVLSKVVSNYDTRSSNSSNGWI